MKYNTLIEILQKQLGFKPSAKAFADILNFSSEKIFYTRAQRNSNFSDKELELIEKFYKIKIQNPTDLSDCIEIENITTDSSDLKIKIGEEIIKNLWNIDNPDNLKTFKAAGDSMADLIEDGNILLIDISKTNFQNGGIFLFKINDNWFIKRLRQRITGELDIISDNPKYPVETIKTFNDINIKGQVVKNLSRGL